MALVILSSAASRSKLQFVQYFIIIKLCFVLLVNVSMLTHCAEMVQKMNIPAKHLHVSIVIVSMLVL